jgi:hypothetical protein
MNRRLAQWIVDEMNPQKIGHRAGPPRLAHEKRVWNQALTWLDFSGLAIYCLHALESSDRLAALPVEVVSGLEQRRDANRFRTAAILRELKTLAEVFQERGVNYAILKGSALIPDYCSNPAMRTQYDHDVLVDADSLQRADRALADAGFRRKPSSGENVFVYRRPEQGIRFTTTAESLYSDRFDRSVELHLRLWEEEEEKIRVNLPDDFLDRKQLRQWEDFRYTALADEDCLLFQVLHAFKHILRNWCRLSIFLEVAFFLRSNVSNALFWERFTDRIEKVRWGPEASFIVFSLAEKLFGASVPPLLRRRLETPRSPALGLWIERYGLRAALSNFHGDKYSLFLHQEFVENPSEWSAIRRRRLFPMHRPNRPPAVVFQRGFSRIGRLWMENIHALGRILFHGVAGIRYLCEYPRWLLLRRLQPPESAKA